MHILISNDDGYLSPGITVLAEQLAKIVQVSIVAPTRNRSAASSSLTLDRPLNVSEIGKNHYIIDGTPTDCVHLGITGLLKKNVPDMVISGINLGQNLGDDVLYSGTVAAAIEGRFLGFPAIAVSVNADQPKHLQDAARLTCDLVKRLIEHPLSAQMLNINIPDVPYDEIAGIEVTRLGSRHLAEPAIEAADPRGRPIYWVGAAGAKQDAGEGTDFYAISCKRVSITPLQVDLTRYQAIDNVKQWLNK